MYNLKDKSHTEKVKFNYLLNGRGSEGLLKKMGGKHLGPGIIQIPINHTLEFDEILKKHKVKYSTMYSLIAQ